MKKEKKNTTMTIRNGKVEYAKNGFIFDGRHTYKATEEMLDKINRKNKKGEG